MAQVEDVAAFAQAAEELGGRLSRCRTGEDEKRQQKDADQHVEAWNAAWFSVKWAIDFVPLSTTPLKSWLRIKPNASALEGIPPIASGRLISNFRPFARASGKIGARLVLARLNGNCK